jgi:hypothetical protein
MIDSSIAFCINELGAVPTPRNTAPSSHRKELQAFTGIKRGDILWWEVNRHWSITASAGWWSTP